MQAELPRICRREYLPTASKHHFVNRTELFSDISSFAQNDSTSDRTPTENSCRCKTERCGIEYEHEIGFYFARKSVYILIS